VSTPDQPPQPEGYEPFFGLREAPFGLAPDPRFLFASASHASVLAQVTYALERREPLVVVTGEIGTGKTLLCRTVLQRLERKTFLSIINDPLLERDELLKQLLQDFGVMPKGRPAAITASRHDLAEALHAFLQSLVPIQAHAVVIVDEAQHLSPDVLEQIRLLSNTSDDHGTLLQIILVGQTDLEALLARPELRQMQQRISRRLRLEPLTSSEVREYIEHRIARARAGHPSQTHGAAELSRALADWNGPEPNVEFAPDAVEAILQFSGGLPRVINLLCDRSLEQAHVFRLRAIDGPLVHMAARALGLSAQPGTARPHAPASTTADSRAKPLAAAPAIGAEPAASPAKITTIPTVVAPPPALIGLAASSGEAPGTEPALANEAERDAASAVDELTKLIASAAAEESSEEATASFDRAEPGSGADSNDADQAAPHRTGARSPSATGPRLARSIALAASAVLATATIWFGVRTARRPTTPAPPAAAAPSTTPAPVRPSEPEPSLTTDPARAETTPAPSAPAQAPGTTTPRAPGMPSTGTTTTRPPTPPSTTGATPAASAPTDPTAQRFEIVVASFHTETRAAAIADQVSAIGLPVRRRVADGWQQIICGPFPSRAGAEEAQQRLERAGLSGAQIVPASR